MAKPGPPYTKKQTTLIIRYIKSSTRNTRDHIRHKHGTIPALLKMINKNVARKLKKNYGSLCNKIIKMRIELGIKVPKLRKKRIYVKKKSH